MRPLIISGLVLALFLTGLPYLASAILVNILDTDFGISAEIEDVDLNVFTGRAAIKGLLAEGHHNSRMNSPLLSVDLDMLSLLQGDINVETVHLEGIALELVESPDGDPVILLPLVAQANEDAAPTEVAIPLFSIQRLELLNSQLKVDGLNLDGTFALNSLVLSGLSSMSDEAGQIALTADWNGAPLSIEGKVLPFAAAPEFDGRIQLTGFQLSGAQGYLPSEISKLAGALTVDILGTLSTSSVSLRTASLVLSEINTGYKHLGIVAEKIDWSGTVDLALDTATQYQVKGDLSTNGLAIADIDRKLQLLTLGGAQLELLEIDSDNNVSLNKALIRQLGTVGEGEQRWLQAGDIFLEDLNYGNNSLTVKQISTAEFVSALSIDSEGQLHSQGVLTASLQGLMEQAESEVQESSTDAGEPLIWRVENMRAERGTINVSEANMIDGESIPFHIDSLVLGTIDSSNINFSTPLSLKARLGEYGKINLDGRLSALDPTASTELTATLKSLPLPPLSPYAESLFGYELTSGQFDHEMKLSIESEQMDASNDIKLRQIKVKSKPDSEPTAPLPVPLELGLNMLRDRKDNITLSLPLKGDLNDPEVGLDQVISKAFGKALTAGSTAYLKLALQPYGAIWMAAETGMKLAGSMNLDAMVFTPLSAELETKQLDYAQKLAVMLNDRPELELKTCGLAGLDDFAAALAQKQAELDASAPPAAPATQPAESGVSEPAPIAKLDEDDLKILRSVARDRGLNLKRYLVKDQGIADERIYLCKADASEQGKVSGVTLSL